MPRRVIATVFLAGLLTAALAGVPQPIAAAPGPVGWVAGTVVDYTSGAPIAGATVERVDGPEATQAGPDGGFLIALPAGRQHLRVRAPGYLAEEETRALAPAGGSSELLFALLPKRSDGAVGDAITARWKAGDRGSGAIGALLRETLAPQAARPGASYRSLLPVVQLGCGSPTTPPGISIAIRVLMPNGCVVAMDLEEYLKGVVPAEMPPTWPPEALKAQAVAARTYALGRMRAEDGAQVDTTTLTQAFSSRRFASTDIAVEATRGQVLTFGGKLAEVFYHSDSGGATEATENVWGGRPQPYLRGVDDRALTAIICGRWADLCWSTTLPEADLRARLGVSGVIASTVISETYPSGRLKTLEVTTTDQKKQRMTALAETWRRRLGAKSALVTAMGRQPDGTFKIVGRGWGHGLGLAQWGAWAHAQQGQEYEAILQHYFPGTALGPAALSRP